MLSATVDLFSPCWVNYQHALSKLRTDFNFLHAGSDEWGQAVLLPITNVLSHVTSLEELFAVMVSYAHNISEALMQLMVPAHVIFDNVGQISTYDYRSLHAVIFKGSNKLAHTPHPLALHIKARSTCLEY